ncbi:MAG: hypothetical protein VYD19_02085 [Myxococcota bacterium]|nr:hypothetical protein [Myxococcota bacterium]
MRGQEGSMVGESAIDNEVDKISNDTRAASEAPSPRLAYYRRGLRRAERLEARLEKRIGQVALVRFVAFALAASCSFSAWYDQAWSSYGPLALIGWLIFAVAVTLHKRPYRLRPRASALAALYRRAISRVEGNWAALPQNDRSDPALSPQAPVERELQLFGEVSLYQLLSRATLPWGKRRVATLLREGCSIDTLPARQAAAQDLAPLTLLRHRVEVEGALARLDLRQLETLKAWLLDETPLPSWISWLPHLGRGLVFLTVTLLLIDLSLEIQTPWQLTLGLQVVIFFYSSRVLRAAYLPLTAAGRHQPLLALAALFERVEGRNFEDPWLSQWREGRCASGLPSARIRALGDCANSLSVHHSAMLYGALSIGILWELSRGSKLLRWRQVFGAQSARDLEALADFEAISSSAGLAYDQPSWAWSTLQGEEVTPFAAEGLGHPLFPAGPRRHNSFQLAERRTLALVTGSNMSGKSSFLRAVGINTRLALAGAPSCADRLQLSPCSIQTSVQVLDDPSQGWSRFYAEVRRISALLRAAEAATAERPLLYLIDEMLSGTNSRERRLASRHIARRLLNAPHCYGLITTHDLDLAALQSEDPTRFLCYHFSDHFDGEKLHFDYQLREGVATGTNALQVLALEGIEVPVGLD